MRLFKDKARYPDFDRAYELYLKRSERASSTMSKGEFIDVIRRYCKSLSDKLERDGFVDLPYDIGSLSAVKIDRKPKYNRTTGKYMPVAEGKAFGICFVPRFVKRMENFRSLGIVANRSLYRRMRKKYDDGELPFYLPDIETYL